MNTNNKFEELIGKPSAEQGRDLSLEALRTILTESPAQRRQRESEQMERSSQTTIEFRKLQEDNEKFKKWQKERRDAGLTATPNEYSTEKRELERNGPTIYMQAGAATEKSQKPLKMPSSPLETRGGSGRGGGGL